MLTNMKFGKIEIYEFFDFETLGNGGIKKSMLIPTLRHTTCMNPDHSYVFDKVSAVYCALTSPSANSLR